MKSRFMLHGFFESRVFRKIATVYTHAVGSDDSKHKLKFMFNKYFLFITKFWILKLQIKIFDYFQNQVNLYH